MLGEALVEPGDLACSEPIMGRYLLVTLAIPFYIDAQGRRYLDRLWVKDLIEHTHYLKNLTLASPCRYQEPPAESVLLDGMLEFENIKFIDLPAPSNAAECMRFLPRTICRLWKAVGDADIVHGGVAGWPIPDGWLLTPITRIRGKFLLIVVESAFWRLNAASSKTLKSRIRSLISERLNRWCVNGTDLVFFTQEQYRQSLLTKDAAKGHVINASWIDDIIIASETEAVGSWSQKLSADDGVLKVLFVGRLQPSKGVKVLLDAMAILSNRQVRVELDILGRGEMLFECETASLRTPPPVKVRVMGTVPYGSQFFNLLRGYHALVVPSISDEQPRVIYDAYSQGIPVLASDTDGIRDCVLDGVTGRLVPSNDPAALAELFIWASENPDTLRRMGLDAIETARGLTHQGMHRRRWQILAGALNQSARWPGEKIRPVHTAHAGDSR